MRPLHKPGNPGNRMDGGTYAVMLTNDGLAIGLRNMPRLLATGVTVRCQ